MSLITYDRCFEATKKHYEQLTAKKYDYVIIGQAWLYYALNDDINQLTLANTKTSKNSHGIEALKEALDNSLHIIVKSGARPIIIRDAQLANSERNPYFTGGTTLKSHSVKSRFFSKKSNSNSFPDDRQTSPVQKQLDQIFSEMKAKYNELMIINLSDVQCENNLCKTEIDGYPVYRDEGYHLSDYASFQFGKIYSEKHGNPFMHKK